MVTTLYLIRHGETEGSGVKRYKGSIDVPLSENGQHQIEQVAEYVVQGLNGSNGLNAIYCSPLSRAIKSAEIIAAPHGLKPIVMNDLRERSFGIWEGMSFTEIKERYPEEFNAWANNPLKYSPVDGENTLELRDRVISALNNIMGNHNGLKGTVPDLRTEQSGVVESGLSPASNIAIVAHGGVNRVILCYIMGIPLENIFRLEQDFAAINIIEFHENFPVVKLLNGGCIG